MKCPKCGFISFDFNETCPKCKKDISGERDKMHHIAFKPEVPFLVGALIGETGDSQTKLEIREPPPPIPLDSGVFDPESISSEDSLEIDLGEDLETVEAASDFMPTEDEEITLGLEDLDIGKDDVLTETGPQTASTPPDKPEVSPEPPALDEDTLSIELADLMEVETEAETAEDYVNEEALTVEVETAKHVDEEPPIEIEEFAITTEPEEPPIFPETEPTEGDEESPLPDLPPETPPPHEDEARQLFSLEDLKADKISKYTVPEDLPPLPGEDPDELSDTKPPPGKTSEVWTEIEKDLEELDFDIEDPE